MRVPLISYFAKLSASRWTPLGCGAGLSLMLGVAQPSVLPAGCSALLQVGFLVGAGYWALRIQARSTAATVTVGAGDELQALGPSLDILRRQVRAGIDKSEGAVMETVTQLIEIQQLSVGLHGEASSALEHSNTISEQLQQLGGESQAALDTFEKHQAALVQQQSLKNQQVTQAMVDVASLTPLVDMIGGIAKQTHLLSFNAAIEAARAGEAGNGFKIVATEVRNLAQKTTEAAKKIEEGIAQVQKVVNGSGVQQTAQLQDVLNSMQVVRELLARNVVHSAKLGPYLHQLSLGMDQGSMSIRNQVVDALGHMQFQDVLRQILEHVERGLGTLAQCSQSMAAGIPLDVSLKQLIQQWEQSYVMLDQRVAHQTPDTVGDVASQGAKIELF